MIKTSIEGRIEQLAYETEKHFHNYEKWFGLAGTPSGETHRADRLTLLPEPFVADAGNDTWGSWLQILGSNDTPVISSNTKYDLHEMQIVSHEHNNNVYAFQLAFGESSELAGILTAETFTEKILVTPSAPGGEFGTLYFQDRRAVVTGKGWIRIWAKGQNTGTLSFYYGLHEYQR